MSTRNLTELAAHLRLKAGFLSKRDIQVPARMFSHLPFPELGPASALGDDAALVPRLTGLPLLACEGIHPTLVEEEPWFAGWSGVLVNLNDIAAMGGRPVAVVNSLWSTGLTHAQQLIAGLKFACDKFSIPMVGGHTNQQSPYNALSVAVLGVAEGPVLSARSVVPDDELWLLVNQAGKFYKHYPFWDAATNADSVMLQVHLELMRQLAEKRIVHAAKDISMGGLVGTAVMFAEISGLAVDLDLDAIARPQGVSEQAWLTCFPSFGYLLAVKPDQTTHLLAATGEHPQLLCCQIGGFKVDVNAVFLGRQGQREPVWQGTETFTGFTSAALGKKLSSI